MKEKIYDAISQIEGLACDVNVNEILSKASNSNLHIWIFGWRSEIRKELRKIREALDDGE
jgi:hypothetical protein